VGERHKPEEALKVIKEIHSTVPEADALLEMDYQKAIKQEAWMLAFLAICIRLDILAQEYNFNTDFRKLPSSQSLLNGYTSAKSVFDPSSGKIAWDELMAAFERHRRGKVGEIYTTLIKDLSNEASNADVLYSFRCSMTHSFVPHTLSIVHGEPSDPQMGLLTERDGTTFLYLGRFETFHKGIYEKVEELFRNGDWWRIRKRLRIGDPVEAPPPGTLRIINTD
jgi:hypothetical protein